MTSTSLKPLIEALSTRLGSSDRALTAAVDLAVLVAAADGRIDAAEKEALAISIQGMLGFALDRKLVSHLVGESREQIKKAGAEARAKAVGEELAARGAADEGLRVALAIAWASEGLSAEERAIVDHVAAAASVGADRVEALAQAVKPSEGA